MDTKISDIKVDIKHISVSRIRAELRKYDCHYLEDVSKIYLQNKKLREQIREHDDLKKRAKIVSSQEEQIKKLTKTVSSQEEQIKKLTKTVSSQEEQIKKLTKTVSSQEEQIKKLTAQRCVLLDDLKKKDDKIEMLMTMGDKWVTAYYQLENSSYSKRVRMRNE